MKTFMVFGGALIASCFASAGQAQVYTQKAELELAADGEAFDIGGTQFRLAPSAVVETAPADADPERDVIVGRYAIRPASVLAHRSRRAAVAGLPAGLAAAVSADGLAVIVAAELNVYFDDAAVLDGLVRGSGGRLLYSSAVGGKATLAFDSVDSAFAAMKRLRAKAGVKEVGPRLVTSRRVAR